jgi:hypothetical protein
MQALGSSKVPATESGLLGGNSANGGHLLVVASFNGIREGLFLNPQFDRASAPLTVRQSTVLITSLRSFDNFVAVWAADSGEASAVVAAAAAAAAIRNVREVQQLNLELVRTAAPELLPDVIRDTEAEAVRAAATGWTRVFPASSNTLLAKQLALFETPRLNNALVARYQQQLCTKNT